MNANKHMFSVTYKGTIRSYDDLCPLQVWTGYAMPSAYISKAIEMGMAAEIVRKVMWSSDGHNNSKYHRRYRRNMLEAIGRSKERNNLYV